MIKQKQAEKICEDLRHLRELWIKVRYFLNLSFTEDPLTGEIEQKFLEAKSLTTKYLRVLAEKIDTNEFQYDPAKINAILRQAISVVHLRGLPIPDRKNILVLWHEVFVHLSQVLGAFTFISEENYQPLKKERKDTSIAALKKRGKKKEKKQGKGKIIFVIILCIVAVVVVVSMMNK
jgi:hypothetical protein